MADNAGLQVIATTISGSIKDWGKVERIVPLFGEHGRKDVTLQTVDSHREARERTCALVAGGCRQVISAGGSGTFNAVLEGCIDSGVELGEVSLGFLRKGSADLIGKALRMPDDIEGAIQVFVDSLDRGSTLPCDVIRAESTEGDARPRHFVGYGGAEIFGRVPHFTENRFMKYYKGILSQLFGDLGPFFVGASLASMERIFRQLSGRRRLWSIRVDGDELSKGWYQAMILVNGDLGKDLPFASGVPLGSGDFHFFGLKDIGVHKLPGQFKRAFDSSIQKNPERWGFEHHRVEGVLDISPSGKAPFPVNVDGSTMKCRGSASFRIVDQINLMARV